MSGGVEGASGSRFRALGALVFLALLALAFANRFVQDDAFISFRYAENLVHGKGLVFNEGDPVEGYTNFLWTLAMTLPLYLGGDPVVFSHLLGLASFTFTLALTYKLACLVLGSRNAGLLAVSVLGTNYTFSAYATGGLETQLQACLFVSSLHVLLRGLTHPPLARAGLLALSGLLAAALLTRPDSAILLAVVLPLAAFPVFRTEGTSRKRRGDLLALLAPVTLIVGIWLGWKLAYYGDLLPNTFFAKVASGVSLVRGILYLYTFSTSYWLLPLPAVLFLTARRLLPRVRSGLCALAVLVGLWMGYVAAVGGEFMEFRFMVPVLPLLAILIAWIVLEGVPRASLRIALVALVLGGSLHHYATFERRYAIESIARLEGHIKNPDENWEGIGRTLGATLGPGDEVTLATTAAGAIPFYSRLRTIDMFGLNDRWIARHGVIIGSRPGHQRVAPLRYLLDRGVHLVLGHPQVVPAADTLERPYSIGDLDRFTIIPVEPPEDLPAEARVLEIPLDGHYKLRALYLRPSAIVDRAIARHGWTVLPVQGP